MKNMASNFSEENIRLTANIDFIYKNQNLFGSKIIKLVELKLSNYEIPNFIGISKDTINTYFNSNIKNKDIEKLLENEVKKQIPASSYAIRSSAFNEDGALSSNAGLFMSQVNVPLEKIYDAVLEIVLDAKKKTNNHFSVIIQEYIKPDYNGVLFTRNPLNLYNLVIEWNLKDSLEVVQGGYFNQITLPFNLNKDFKNKPFISLLDLVNICKSIEQKYNFPQDVEWVIKNKKIYILQTRNITSLSKNDYENFIFLDQNIKEFNYFYSKKDLQESFDKPLPLTESILRNLYSKNNAIHSAYKKIGVLYNPIDIFLRFKNEIYVDKEKELKQLFPSYSYFGGNKPKPHLQNFKGFFTTFLNIYKFSSFSLNQDKIIKSLEDFKIKIENFNKNENNNFLDTLNLLNEVYSEIFLINLITDKTQKDIQFYLKNEDHSLLELLNSKIDDLNEINLKRLEFNNLNIDLFGNSLNISDENPFLKTEINYIKLNNDLEIDLWWKKLPFFQRILLKKKITFLIYLQSFREQGRWLSVFCINILRNKLKKQAIKLNLDDYRILYFANLEEIINNNIDIVKLYNRKSEFEKDYKFYFPVNITNLDLFNNQKSYGVSPGAIKGKVVSLGDKNIKNCILLVEKLDSTLVNHFKEIKGIISLEGGLLSHLAIMAREAGMPVVIDPNAKFKIPINSVVEIDGLKGTINLIKE